MRARNIKPGFFANDLIAELPYEGRLLFIGLWLVADRAGRLENRPKKIKAAIFPFDDLNVEPLLVGLQSKGFLKIYEVDGVSYIEILKFAKHQSPHVKEVASTIPEPDKHQTSPGNSGASTGLAPDKHQAMGGNHQGAGSITESKSFGEEFVTQGGEPESGKAREIPALAPDKHQTSTRQAREIPALAHLNPESNSPSLNPIPESNPRVFSPQDKTGGTGGTSDAGGRGEPVRGFVNLEPIGLASQFRNAKAGSPSSQESLEACECHFRAAIASGAKPEALLAEIQSKSRNRAEPIWELLRRLTPVKAGGPGRYGKPARLTPRQLGGLDP